MKSSLVDVVPLLKTAVHGHAVRLPSGKMTFVQYHEDKRAPAKIRDLTKELTQRGIGSDQVGTAKKAITVLLGIANAGVWINVLTQMAHLMKSVDVVSLEKASEQRSYRRKSAKGRNR